MAVLFFAKAGPQGELQLQQPIGIMKPGSLTPLLR